MTVLCTWSMEPLPVRAYNWLVKKQSTEEGGTVEDVCSKTGYVMVPDLKEGQNADSGSIWHHSCVLETCEVQ